MAVGFLESPENLFFITLVKTNLIVLSVSLRVHQLGYRGFCMNNFLFSTTVNIFCKLFNASESSRHRTTDHNRAVGGVSDSQHLGFKAVDLILDDWSVKDNAINWLKHMGLFVLDETPLKHHLHVDDRFNTQL